MLISVVIATLNADFILAECLESVAGQDCKGFEVVVADGLSTDKTAIVAESFRSRLPALIVSQQKDGGVYEAINRGVRQAKGDWILILGSDDRLAASNVFDRLATKLKDTKADIVYGDVVMIGPNRWVPSGGRYPGEIGIAFLALRNICQQGMLYRRSALNEDGGFNPRYRVCADWVYLLNAYYRRPIERVDLIICHYATGGLSSHTLDPAFTEDKLDILGRTIARSPFDRGLRSIGWQVRQCFARALQTHSMLVAVRLAAAYLKLKLSSPSR